MSKHSFQPHMLQKLNTKSTDILPYGHLGWNLIKGGVVCGLMWEYLGGFWHERLRLHPVRQNWEEKRCISQSTDGSQLWGKWHGVMRRAEEGGGISAEEWEGASEHTCRVALPASWRNNAYISAGTRRWVSHLQHLKHLTSGGEGGGGGGGGGILVGDIFVSTKKEESHMRYHQTASICYPHDSHESCRSLIPALDCWILTLFPRITLCWTFICL